jgi:hypothetical protein
VKNHPPGRPYRKEDAVDSENLYQRVEFYRPVADDLDSAETVAGLGLFSVLAAEAAVAVAVAVGLPRTPTAP